MAGSDTYTHVIDLTSKAQRNVREVHAQRLFPPPQPVLPPATPETLPAKARVAFDRTGWTQLMPVQEQVIPYMIYGRDLIVQSRTGSGKTGAFLLPLFAGLDVQLKGTQALILTPTRELARQIYAEFDRMNSVRGGLRGALVYGGVRYKSQVRDLRAGAQLVVGTPGRILDHLDRGVFTLESLDTFVLDEADEMLSMGFYPAMVQVKNHLPQERRSYMFSATMPPKVRLLGREFLTEPSFVGLSTGRIGVETIEHRYYRVDPMEKDRSLIRLLEMENPESALVFANTKREVEYLVQFLENFGYDVAHISGDLPQRTREAAMERLRRGRLRFLVATDVAARGIDISDLSHVFQYDVPVDPEYYIHRTGRTARAGKAGTAVTLVTFEDEGRLQRIARLYDVELEKRTMPEPEDVAARVGERMVVLLEAELRSRSNLEKERLRRFIPLVEELVKEEPELMAMLVDDLYHDRMNPNAGGVQAPADIPKKKRRSRGRRRHR